MTANLLQNKVLTLFIAIVLISGVLSIGIYTSLNNNGSEIEDIKKPIINDNTNNIPITGDSFKISADVSDNKVVDSVYLNYNITTNDKNIINFNKSMDQYDSYFYNVDIVVDAVKLNYTILAKDNSNNWNSTSNHIEVKDDINPNIDDMSAKKPTAGKSFKVTADVTDNIEVESVSLEYTLISNNYSQTHKRKMSLDSFYWHNITLWKNTTGLDYTIFGKDTSDNKNSFLSYFEVKKPDYMFGWSVGDQEDGYGTIVHTDDGGTDWDRQGDPSTIPDASLSQVRALNRSTAWIVGGKSDGYGTVLKTTDSGKTWDRIADDLIPNSDIEGVSIIDKDTVWIAGQNNTLLFTHDGGGSWEDKSDSSYDSYTLSDIVAVDENNIWICGGSVDNHGLILHSTDGGESWTREAEDLLRNHSLISLSVVNESQAWAIGGGSTVIKTTDGGNTWNKVGKDVFPSLIDGNGICALDNDIVWVVLDYGNIYITNNNGENWTQQKSNASGYYLLRITAINETTAWVTGSAQFPPVDGVLLHTTDGGKTWERVDYGLNSGLWDIYFVDAYH